MITIQVIGCSAAGAAQICKVFKLLTACFPAAMLAYGWPLISFAVPPLLPLCDGEGNRLYWERKIIPSAAREFPDFWEFWDEDDPRGQYYASRPAAPDPNPNLTTRSTPVDLSLIESVYRRQVVEFNGFVKPGTIIIEPKAHFLYHALGNKQATRYGVGVGRDGFAWSGEAEIRMKRSWPRWVPPKEMVARDKRARKWANGQPGGPDNPLGARALYSYSAARTRSTGFMARISPRASESRSLRAVCAC